MSLEPSWNEYASIQTMDNLAVVLSWLCCYAGSLST